MTRVFRTAETTADLYHMGRLTGAVRNIGMRIIGGRGLIGRYSWIYGWRPPGAKRKAPPGGGAFKPGVRLALPDQVRPRRSRE